MINNKKLLEAKFKRVWYFNIILFLPLLFINEDIIIGIDVFKNYSDYIGGVFLYIEQLSIYAKSIGGEYYTIKFIYSSSYIVAIVPFVCTFYICTNLYLYNLNIIKNTEYDFEITSIKETGSWLHSIILALYIIILSGSILYWQSELDTINHIGKFTTALFTNKYIAISLSTINAMILGSLSALIIIDLLAKIYSRNFRIIEQLGKDEKKVFLDTKKALLSKKNMYSILLLIIVLFIYGISELFK